jgi:hypothetical protein
MTPLDIIESEPTSRNKELSFSKLCFLFAMVSFIVAFLVNPENAIDFFSIVAFLLVFNR